MKTFLFQMLILAMIAFLNACTSQEISKPNIIVIFTDDHGYADLGEQGYVDDLKTPNLDQLARDGVRMTSGYVTAPQCIPSRAGLISGQYQQKLGVDHNGTIPMPLDVTLLPARMQEAGYTTGMAGKWHLEPNHTQKAWILENMPELGDKEQYKPSDIPFEKKLPYFPSQKGFQETYYGEMRRYYANYDLEGNSIDFQYIPDDRFRVDVQTDAALAFIKRNHDKPFFFYLAYFAPHVPLEATEKYLSRFPGDMPERRRYCLAMVSAMDDGVGKIKDALKQYGIEENTMIFFIGDNGAPLKIYKEDIPVSFPGGAWDGSLNDPLNGEKGMVSEGGIRVPFLVSWPAKFPKNMVYDEPVISLDVAATSLAAAGLDIAPELDGVNLIPYLTGKKKGAPHESLFWEFWSQAAIRKGDWKLLEAGGKQYLFDLSKDIAEQNNLVQEYPEKVEELKKDLEGWAKKHKDGSLPKETFNSQENDWYGYYFKNN